MDESLWPARNVAEHAYCPRLFYLMEVEGIHVPSADTLKGVAVHRRVDRPSNAPKPAEDDDADHQEDREREQVAMPTPVEWCSRWVRVSSPPCAVDGESSDGERAAEERGDDSLIEPKAELQRGPRVLDAS